MTSISDPSSTPPDPGVGDDVPSLSADTGLDADAVVQRLHRSDWGRLLALLVARTRRLDLAEDALGEAFARALTRWRVDGVPDSPAAWVHRTAHRQVLGRLRAEAVAGRKAPLLVVRSEATGSGWAGSRPGTNLDDAVDELPDERLQLILLCCHPALPTESRSALALRLVLGTPTDQIARLFLVSKPTMAARLTRAKKKIAVAGIPLASPVEDELRIRLDEVCRTVYLAFTAGYSPGSGPDLLRADIAGEAVRLAALLHGLAPGAPQVRAMLALLLLQHSRRDARMIDRQLVTLDEQDRSRWRADEIRAGLELLDGLSRSSGYAEELRLQASIAAEHARSPAAADTDWSRIAGFYAELEALTGSAVVRLNRAVAVAEAEGPQAGLALLTGLEQLVPTSHRVPAVRGELARRAGDLDLARRSLKSAIDLCSNEVERTHLLDRLRSLPSR